MGDAGGLKASDRARTSRRATRVGEANPTTVGVSTIWTESMMLARSTSISEGGRVVATEIAEAAVSGRTYTVARGRTAS